MISKHQISSKFSILIRFEDIWKFKEDIDNTHERYYKDIVERDKMVKIEQEIRNIVDAMMRSELELLQAAYDRDKAIKGKKGKKPQKVNIKLSNCFYFYVIKQTDHLIYYPLVIHLLVCHRAHK